MGCWRGNLVVVCHLDEASVLFGRCLHRGPFSPAETSAERTVSAAFHGTSDPLELEESAQKGRADRIYVARMLHEIVV